MDGESESTEGEMCGRSRKRRVGDIKTTMRSTEKYNTKRKRPI